MSAHLLTSQRTAAGLRRAAAALDAEATALRAMADDLDAQAIPSSGRPLRGFALKAASHIRAHPGQTGEEIAAAIGCAPDSFRHFAHKLKDNGFTCRTWGGGGYFPPRKCVNTPS